MGSWVIISPTFGRIGKKCQAARPSAPPILETLNRPKLRQAISCCQYYIQRAVKHHAMSGSNGSFLACDPLCGYPATLSSTADVHGNDRFAIFDLVIKFNEIPTSKFDQRCRYLECVRSCRLALMSEVFTESSHFPLPCPLVE